MQSSPTHANINIRRQLSPPIPIRSGLTAGWLLLSPNIVAAAFSSTSLDAPRPQRAHSNKQNYIWRSCSSRPQQVPIKDQRNSFRLMSSSGNSSSDIGTGASSSLSLPSKWSDILTLTDTNNNKKYQKYASNLFPPLTQSSHKGSHGRIAIFGGSEKYTGAPYYAAQSALHCGTDLATIFCAQEASIPIKCYSPELMVQSVYSIEALDALVEEESGMLKELKQCKQSNDLITAANEVNAMELLATMDKLEPSNGKQLQLIQSELKNDDKMEEIVVRLTKVKELEDKLQQLREKQEVAVNSIVDTITSVFPTLHILCIGPGLGRHPLVFATVEKVIEKAMEFNMPLVLDADALFMLSLKEYRNLLGELRGYDRCIMTPNLMELRRLKEADSEEDANEKKSHSGNKYGSIVVQKGNVDIITQGKHTMQCKEEGGLKRSGGIGDVLAGTISAFMAWNAILEKEKMESNGCNIDELHHQRVFASWAACCTVKKGTNLAFQKKRRAMSALDVFEEIGGVIGSMEKVLELELDDKS